MSLDHILLGMLEKPAAGYDLGREFGASARLFWAAELSQIYPTLKRMEARGLLTSKEVPSAQGPARRVYRRTAEGTTELEGWLRADPELGNQRVPYVAQFYFLGQLDDAAATSNFVRRLAASLEERLAVYAEIERCIRAEQGEPRELTSARYHRYATLRAGVMVAEARLAWCQQTMDALEARDAEARRKTAETGVV